MQKITESKYMNTLSDAIIGQKQEQNCLDGIYHQSLYICPDKTYIEKSDSRQDKPIN
nr:hypothetical protein [Arenibacter echinorum]